MSYLSELLDYFSSKHPSQDDVSRRAAMYDQMSNNYYEGGGDPLAGVQPIQSDVAFPGDARALMRETQYPELPQASYSNEGKLNALLEANRAYQNPTAPYSNEGRGRNAAMQANLDYQNQVEQVNKQVDIDRMLNEELSKRGIRTAGFKPEGIVGNEQPQKPQPRNFIRNESTGKVIDLDYAAAPRPKDPWVDGAQVISRQPLSDGRFLVVERVPAMDGFGRQSTGIRERIEGETLAQQKTRAEIGERQAKAEKARAEAKAKGMPTEEKPMTAGQRAKFEGDFAKDYGAVVETDAMMSDVLKDIEAIKQTDKDALAWREGYTGVMPAWAQGEQAKIAEQRLQALKGKITQLGKQKASLSGAIGNMAVQEWDIVRDMITKFDPTAGNLNEQLSVIEGQARVASKKAREQYEAQYADRFDKYPRFKLKEPNVEAPQERSSVVTGAKGDLVRMAKEAVAQGKSRSHVAKMLQDMGVSPAEAGL